MPACKPWYICRISGGVASWLAAKRMAEKYGRAQLILLFADTKAEEKSTYRFIEECVADIGTCYGFHILSDGRTPWELFRDRRFLSNNRVDHCSQYLKRELLDRWVKARFTSANSVQVFGYDWTEGHRLEKLRKRFSPWPVEAPLCGEVPAGASIFDAKPWIIQQARNAGLSIPFLYSQGFSHNNCGGKCVKAGQAHWAQLFRVLPAVYAEAEMEEGKLRVQLGNVAILRDRTGGKSRPLPLSEFRARIEAEDYDKFDFGSCSCFTETEEAIDVSHA